MVSHYILTLLINKITLTVNLSFCLLAFRACNRNPTRTVALTMMSIMSIPEAHSRLANIFVFVVIIPNRRCYCTFCYTASKAIGTGYTQGFFFLKRLDGNQQLIILYFEDDFKTCLLSRVYFPFIFRFVSLPLQNMLLRTGLDYRRNPRTAILYFWRGPNIYFCTKKKERRNDALLSPLGLASGATAFQSSVFTHCKIRKKTIASSSALPVGLDMLYGFFAHQA